MKRWKALGRFLLALARELSDENAYRRHLAAHGCVHSGEEWRKFSEHHLRAKYTRAKCCGFLLAALVLAGAHSLAIAETLPLPPLRERDPIERQWLRERLERGGGSQGGLYTVYRDPRFPGRELHGQAQWDLLRTLVAQRNPRRIGIDMSETHVFAHGL